MRILIADDERIARGRLRRLVEKLGEEVVGEAANGAEALAMARALAPDVLLLDIDMPGLDGLAVAEQPDVPPVVFTTAHRQHAVEAFDAGAFDYLLKPVSEERLLRALEKVRARRGEGEGGEAWRLVVQDGPLKRLIDAREVACFSADHKYVAFRHGADELLLRDSLDALEARLARHGFLRVSRSALVRRDAVTAYDAKDGAVVLEDGARVSVSRRLAPAVRAALGVG